MLSVKRLLANKRSNQTLWWVRPNDTVFSAIQMMAENNIGAVTVMENGKLVGIFSERDYVRKGIIQGRESKSTLINEVMTTGVLTVGPNDDLEDCMRLMSGHRIRHLPVVDGENVMGMVSVNDVVQCIMDEQKNRIESLEQYITGR